MSILGFLLKPKRRMAKKHTKHIRVGKYTITKHAQNRITEKNRKISKLDILNNLFTKPNGITKIKVDNLNRPSYNRVGKYATTSINPETDYVVSCRPVSDHDVSEFDLINIRKKGQKKKYVKRNSKKTIYRSRKRRNAKTSKRSQYHKTAKR